MNDKALQKLSSLLIKRYTNLLCIREKKSHFIEKHSDGHTIKYTLVDECTPQDSTVKILLVALVMISENVCFHDHRPRGGWGRKDKVSKGGLGVREICLWGERPQAWSLGRFYGI